MSPRRFRNKQSATIVSVVAIVLALLSVIGTLAGSAGAGTTGRSAEFASTHGVDPALARALTKLTPEQIAARREKRRSKPKPPKSTPTPTPPVTTPPVTTPPVTTPTPTPPVTTPPANDLGTLVWSDEFSGAAGSAPDPSVWSFQNGGRWGNGELECYTNSPQNTALDGSGDLVITARYTPGHVCNDGAINNFTSSRLNTMHQATTKYGKIRVRAMLPVASGIWPAIWGMGDDLDSVGWPNNGEIDMAEAIGESKQMYGNIHFPSTKGPAGLGTGYQLSSPMNTSYHVYGVDWSPNSVALSVDEHVYKTITKADVQAAGGTWVFDRPFFVLLNVAVGGDWPGAPKDLGAFPQSMKVDYVRVYQ